MVLRSADHKIDEINFIYGHTINSVTAGDGRWDALQEQERSNMDMLVRHWQEDARTKECPDAMTHLGVVYFEGRGVPTNRSLGLAWTRKAADMGNSRAQLELGKRFLTGDGVELDQQEAYELFTKAALQGNAEGLFYVGQFHHQNLLVESFKDVGFKLYVESAEKGHPIAALYVARCYYVGDGVQQNLNKAATWFTRAADQGVYEAQISIGIMIFLGECSYYEKDPKELKRKADVHRWFQLASEKGPHGQYLLAMTYVSGCGVPCSLDTYIDLLRKAASYGHPGACYELAVAYSYGYGVPVDKAQSRTWVYEARSLGYFLPCAYSGKFPPDEARGIIVADYTLETICSWLRWFRMAKAHKRFAQCTRSAEGAPRWTGYMGVAVPAGKRNELG